MWDVKKYLPLIILLVLGGVAFFVAWIFLPSLTPLPVEEENITTELPSNPASSQGGFEHLVSLSDARFEPSEVRVRAGDTIRFINNSGGKLWLEGVSSIDNPPYPEEGECGESAFNSCKNLSSGEFWEFKFKEQGTWLFHNKSGKQVGVVYVGQ